ncbi:MAG: HepT-like ribonuclease domain-containing protein [Candidatus Latescibacterota bacterium]
MWKDEGYLLDILNEARKLVLRFKGITRDGFSLDEERQYVAFWSISIMGEAAGKISPEFRTNHPELPWREMIGIRNVLVHNYARIDLDIVWGVITISASQLINVIEPLLPGEEES